MCITNDAYRPYTYTPQASKDAGKSGHQKKKKNMRVLGRSLPKRTYNLPTAPDAIFPAALETADYKPKNKTERKTLRGGNAAPPESPSPRAQIPHNKPTKKSCRKDARYRAKARIERVSTRYGTERQTHTPRQNP